MKNLILFFGLLFSFATVQGQSVDDKLSRKKMRKDFEIFKKIRLEANSGLYKYRTKKSTDSIYNWAEKKIEKSHTYRDFYNIISKLTDFEGSLHNNTSFDRKKEISLTRETSGYFPFPLKIIQNKVLLNFITDEIPLGAEIISINGESIDYIIPNLYKYYTTDGLNITGKSKGINRNFSRFYRLHYGTKSSFKVTYRIPKSNEIKNVELESVGYKNFYKNFKNRYSKKYDEGSYKGYEDNEIYSYKQLDDKTGVLTINSFSMGNASSESHKTYVAFLDSTFSDIRQKNIKNLIVDVRNNGGGTDPNDLVTYEYLTQRNFQENKEAWISFNKIKYLKYITSKIPRFLRPLGVGNYNKSFQRQFPDNRNGKYYQDENSDDHKVRKPNKNAFKGTIYLLVSPNVASAGSLFAAMVTSNENSIVIGEETMGGYYGHNGHTPLSYTLPKSKIETVFSVVNLEQDVAKHKNQKYHRGIIPDYDVSQSFEDFINHKDVQMEYVLKLIEK